MTSPRPLALHRLALLAALALPALGPARAGAQEPPWEPETEPTITSRLGLGVATLGFTGAAGDRVTQGGVAVTMKVRYRRSPRFGVDYTLTWGLTDWDRAREWIDAGNRAGGWTTDRIQAVGDWAVADRETAGLRMMGAFFADAFLVGTYAAVPFCYVGSLGGATSHLQVDVTANLHGVDGPVDGWVEAGLGAVALPTVAHDWDFGLGPVVGMGLDLGPFRVGARVLWSPPALHTASRLHGTYVASAATVSFSPR